MGRKRDRETWRDGERERQGEKGIKRERHGEREITLLPSSLLSRIRVCLLISQLSGESISV